MVTTDDDYSRAGLLPPGFVLRARTRDERQEYSEWRQECDEHLSSGELWLDAELVTWVDWQFRIFSQAAKKHGVAHGNPVWWQVRREENRRMVLAAWGGRLPWQK